MNRCWTCQRRLDDYRHYKTCVSKKYWPDELQTKRNVEQSRQFINTPDTVCETCGFEAKNKFGLASHVRKHTAVLSD